MRGKSFYTITFLTCLVLLASTARAEEKSSSNIGAATVDAAMEKKNDTGTAKTLGVGVRFNAVKAYDFVSPNAATIDGHAQVALGAGSLTRPEGGSQAVARSSGSMEANALARFKSEWLCSPTIGVGTSVHGEYATAGMTNDAGIKLLGQAGVSCIKNQTFVVLAPLVGAGARTSSEGDGYRYSILGGRALVSIDNKVYGTAQLEKRTGKPTEDKELDETELKAQIGAKPLDKIFIGVDASVTQTKTKTLSAPNGEKTTKSLYGGLSAGLAF